MGSNITLTSQGMRRYALDYWTPEASLKRQAPEVLWVLSPKYMAWMTYQGIQDTLGLLTYHPISMMSPVGRPEWHLWDDEMVKSIH